MKFEESKEEPVERRRWPVVVVMASVVALWLVLSWQKEELGQMSWGIAGLGRIAHDFATSLKANGGRLDGVAAASLPDAKRRAEDFSKRYGGTPYDTYEGLASSEVQVVYIATTNQLHKDMVLLFLRAGKHVVVEKPSALSTEELEEMIAAARLHKRLLVTNFWTMAFPVVEWALSQDVKTRLVRGDMGFRAHGDRFLDPSLGGGAMYDMGCYLAHLFVQIAGNTSFDVVATGRVDSGVDVETDFIVTTPTMELVGSTSLLRDSPFDFQILGETGSVVLDPPANCPTSAHLRKMGSEPVLPCCASPITSRKSIHVPLQRYPAKFQPEQYPHGMGFVYMQKQIEICLIQKCRELPQVPYWSQLATQRIIDDVLDQVL